MWSSRLFWKLFLAFAGLIFLTVGSTAAIVAGWQEEQLIEQCRRRLHSSATLIREKMRSNFPPVSTPQLQTQVSRLGKETATRYTIIDPKGMVLADSDQPSLETVQQMDNHLNRPEIVLAAREGSGFSRRLSATLKRPFLYHALSVEQDDELEGFVRSALPLEVVLSEVDGIRGLIWRAGLGIGLIGLVGAYWLARRIAQPVRVLIDAVQHSAGGGAPRRLSIRTHDELEVLAREFEQMVAESHARQAALQESASRQSTILSGMNEGVLAVDQRQKVLFANRAAGKTLGFDPQAAVGRLLLEVVRSDELHEIVQRAVATGQLAQSEIEWQADQLRTLDVNATPLPGNPCPGVVLVMHDSTELKRLEGLRQQFVANVSHELKTPLSSIKAYTETLLSGALDDAGNAQRFLHRIDDQADRLHELILDMLALARIESGHLALELTEIPVSRVSTSCVADVDERAKSAQVTVKNEMANSRLSVIADEESLKQILGNLIDNALKYTPTGGDVTLRSYLAEDDPQEVVIEVTDTGPGIELIHHERLFERFYRVDKARSRELGGTGLGLSIVKHLCQAMDGSVSVESQPGAGSVFRVRLPRAADPADNS